MAKVINLVERYIGGAGTSLFASFLLEFYLSKQFEPILVDFDRVNPDVLERYRSSCAHETSMSLFPIDNKRGSSIDYLLSLVYERDREAIVNVPSGAFDRIDEFVRENVFQEVRLRRWFVSSLEPKSWSIFEKIADSHEDKFQLVLVHNLRSGLEMTQEQEEFCGDREIRVVKMSRFEFPEQDLQLIQDKPSLPLSKMPFSEQGQRRLDVHMQRIFAWIFSVVICEL